MPVAKKKITKRAVKNVYNEATKRADKAVQDYWDKKWNEIGVDNDQGIDAPLHARGGRWKWNFESENMSSELAIMWILAGLCILFALFAMHGDQQALNAGLIH